MHAPISLPSYHHGGIRKSIEKHPRQFKVVPGTQQVSRYGSLFSDPLGSAMFGFRADCNNSRLELLMASTAGLASQDHNGYARIERGRTCVAEEVAGSAWTALALA